MDNLRNAMKTAIEQAKQSQSTGNKGYGAVILKDNEIIAKAYDCVAQTHDPTSHAEMNVIRKTCEQFGPDLKGFTLVSTCEPCPMCCGAAIWANISKLVFGASIQDTIKIGRTRINLPADQIIARSPVNMKIVTGIEKEECLKLYDY